MTDGEHFQRSGQQHPAMYFRLNVEVVGDLKIVHDRLENLVHFSWRGQQTSALQTIQDVDFGRMLPLARRFDGRTILRGRHRLIVDRGRFDRHFGEFFLTSYVLQVVAPQTGLGLEANVAAQKILQVGFLAVNVRRKPQAGLNVQAPAVEVQVKAVDARHRRVHAVEPDNREILVFRPDTALESALSGFRQRSDVKNHAARFTQEFPAYVVELIMLAIESLGVDVNHLQKAFRNIRGREQSAHVRDGLERVNLAFALA